MSISRLVGICFIAGAVLNFIPFVVNIILGGNPAEGEPVMDYFYKNIINGGFNSRLFAVFGTLSAALLAYAVNALSNIEQEKEKNALMGLGAFLSIFGFIGLAIAWAFDISMLFGSEASVGSATPPAGTGNFFLLQFGLWIAFGVILWLGQAIFTWTLVAKGYANDILLQAAAVVNGLAVIAFLNTLFNVDYNSMASIMPMFIALMVGTIINTAWQLLVGKTMMDS